MQTNNQNQQTQQPPQTKQLAPIQQVQALVYAQEDQFNQLSSQYNAMIKFKTEAHLLCKPCRKTSS